MGKKRKKTKKNLETLAKFLLGLGAALTGIAELIKALK